MSEPRVGAQHVAALLALTSVKEPHSFGADALRAAKEKVVGAVHDPADLANARWRRWPR